MRRVLLTVVVAACSACSSVPNCTVANCAGCCTTDGKCASGDTAAECGKGAVECARCGAAQGCVDGMCIDASNGGGSAQAGGGGAALGGGTATGGGIATGGG